MEVTTLVSLFYDLTVNQVFGSLLLTGIGMFIILVGLGVAMNISLDAILVVAIPMILSLVAYGYLAEFINPLIVIAMGTIVGLALLRLVRR